MLTPSISIPDLITIETPVNIAILSSDIVLSFEINLLVSSSLPNSNNDEIVGPIHIDKLEPCVVLIY